MARRTYALAQAIGQRLRQARAAAGLTNDQLAALAHVDVSTVEALSIGRTANPGIGTLVDLAKALKVRAAWLLLGEGEMDKP